MDTAAEIGRNPVSKPQIQPEYGDEKADAGRDCRIHLTRPNSQARTGTGKYSFSLFSLLENPTGDFREASRGTAALTGITRVGVAVYGVIEKTV